METKAQSDAIKELAGVVMDGAALVSLETLRMSLDKHAVDVEHRIEERDCENPVVDRIMELLEDNRNGRVSRSDVENSVQSVVESYELPKEHAGQLYQIIDNTFSLSDHSEASRVLRSQVRAMFSEEASILEAIVDTSTQPSPVESS